MELVKKNSCFIVTPIGGDNTDIRRAAEGVIDAVIIPTLSELGFNEDAIRVAHRMANAGSINKQLIRRILEDDLVVVNLTKLNPNVMYELAVRHAVRKPVIQICERNTSLPFDIIDERTIFYDNDMKGGIELKEKFVIAVQEALKEKNPDNPIYRATEELNILKVNESKEEVNLSKYILDRLDSLESNIVNINRNNTSSSIRKNKNYVEAKITVFAKDNSTSEDITNYLLEILIPKGLRVHTYGPAGKMIPQGFSQTFTFTFEKFQLDLSSVREIENLETDIFKVEDLKIFL